MNRILFFLLCLWCPTFIFGQTISRGEYYINSDSGIGNAIAFEVENNIVNGVINLNINPTSAQPGINTLGIRFKNNSGSWSHTSTSLFYACPALAIQNVLTAEYFIDSDPGFDNGVAINVSPSTNILLVENVNLSGLSDGLHTIGIRSKSNTGEWSQTHSSILFVSSALSQSQLSRFEYFIDADPGFGHGMQASNSQISGTQQLVLSDINVSSLPSGMHVIGVRGMNQNGTWSHTERKLFYKSNGLELKSLVAYEYFIDTDPGFGTGIAFTPPSNNGEMTEVNQNIDISNLSPGSHTIFWRTKDEDGKWSLTGSRTFQICDIEYSLTVNDASCYNGSDGQIAISISSSQNPTYSWSPSGLTGSGTSTISGLTAGNYNCSITTTSGCNFSQVITVSQPDRITNYFTIEECLEYNFFGQTLMSSGTYTATTIGQGGCEELNVLNLVITQDYLTYYADNDGDGYGAGLQVQFCDPPASGYSLLANDCNDNNATVYPNAPELCGDNLDNDCDGNINEGCNANAPANDNRASAVVMTGVTYPLCSNKTGTLLNAGDNGEALSTEPVGTGEDVWYSFVAQSQGARIQANSSQYNLALELQDAAGTTLLFSENETSVGQEVLIASGLTVGATYYVAVRNFGVLDNSIFTICIQHLRASVPNNGTTFANLCSYIKASWTGAQLYSATFVNGSDSYTASNNSTQIPFSLFNGLQYGTSYSVTFSNTFILPDAGGNNVTTVVTSAPFNVSIAAHPSVELRAADRCPTARTRGAFISTNVVVCGAVEYEWEFVEVDANDIVIGIQPILVESNSTSRYLRVSQIPGVQDGDRYRVRIRPVFSYGPGTFTSGYQLLCVAGQAPINAPILEEGDVFAPSAVTAAERAFEVYPNPNAGDVFNVRLAGINSDSIELKVIDALGRTILIKEYSDSSMVNTSITFEVKLNSGVYNIIVLEGDRTSIKRMLVL